MQILQNKLQISMFLKRTRTIVNRNLDTSESAPVKSNKTVKFGYKLWCPNSKSRHIAILFYINIQIFGSASAPFLPQKQELPLKNRNLKYSLQSDNIFTSFLLLHFSNRDTHIPKKYPLISKKYRQRTLEVKLPPT